MSDLGVPLWESVCLRPFYELVIYPKVSGFPSMDWFATKFGSREGFLDLKLQVELSTTPHLNGTHLLINETQPFNYNAVWHRLCLILNIQNTLRKQDHHSK